MRYLLDTNIVSDIVRNPRGTAAKQFRRVGQAATCISIIVAAELRYGLMRNGASALAPKISEALDQFAVMTFESPADQYYGEVRAALEESGQGIGPNDTFIAAHALALGCTLVTDNEREFARVPGLAVENWLR
jgi:tRNA(fMet)-specific endonuclease VapC